MLGLNKVVVLGLATLITAIPSPVPRHTLHEKRATTSSWTKLERIHENLKLPMRIGLTQSNLDKGHEYLMNVAHPESPNFGKHYTTEEVVEIFAPSQDAVNSVRNWLESAGMHLDRTSLSANKQWIQFDATAAEAENLFQTKYHFYESENGKSTIGCDEYSVPEHIRHHIDYITPGIKLFAPNTKSRKPAANKEKRAIKLPPLLKPLPDLLASILQLPLLAICRIAIIPDCISTMYKIPQSTTAVSGNELGIFEDLGDVYSQTDLNLFFLTLQQRIPLGTHPTLEAIDGAVAPNPVTSAGPESDLDFQISYPIIWPQNSILFQTDDPVYEANYVYDGFLNNFLDAIDGSYCIGDNQDSPLDPPYPNPAPGGYKGNRQCGVYKPTNVISISYGGQEPDLSELSSSSMQ